MPSPPARFATPSPSSASMYEMQQLQKQDVSRSASPSPAPDDSGSTNELPRAPQPSYRGPQSRMRNWILGSKNDEAGFKRELELPPALEQRELEQALAMMAVYYQHLAAEDGAASHVAQAKAAAPDTGSVQDTGAAAPHHHAGGPADSVRGSLSIRSASPLPEPRIQEIDDSGMPIHSAAEDAHAGALTHSVTAQHSVRSEQLHGATVLPDPATEAQLHSLTGRISDAFAKLRTGPMKHPINYAASLVRDGGITTVTTLLREVFHFYLVKKNILTPEQMTSLSAGLLGLAVLGNIAAMATHQAKGIGNARTRTGQLINMGLVGGAALIAHQTGTMGIVMPLLAKAAVYSLARDTSNLFVTVRDTRDTSGKPPGVLPTLINTLPYAALSIMVNYMQSSAGASSGGAAAAAGMELKEAIGKILAFSAANGVGEGWDNGNLAYIMAFLQARQARKEGATGEDVRKGMGDVNIELGLHMPTFGELVEKGAGAMNARNSAFNAVYGSAAALGKNKGAGVLTPNDISNIVIGLQIGLFCPIFISCISTSPRQRVDPSAV